MVVGANDLTVRAEDLAGHLLDHAYTLHRHVLDPGSYPVPVITKPDSGRYYGEGDTIPLDGTASTVPDGYETWFGVLVDEDSDTLDLHYQAQGLGDSFTTSSSDPAYRVRLVVATPERMPDEDALRGRVPPCVLGDPDLGCASTDVVISRQGSSQLYPFGSAMSCPMRCSCAGGRSGR